MKNNLAKAVETLEISDDEVDDEFDIDFDRKWIESKGKTFMTSRGSKRRKVSKLVQVSAAAAAAAVVIQKIEVTRPLEPKTKHRKVKEKQWTPSAEKLVRCMLSANSCL